MTVVEFEGMISHGSLRKNGGSTVVSLEMVADRKRVDHRG